MGMHVNKVPAISDGYVLVTARVKEKLDFNSKRRTCTP